MASERQRALQGIVLDEGVSFTLVELCRACDVNAELILEMVEEGVLEPTGTVPVEWCFSGRMVIRAQRALRLTRDLRVNWPGAALALDLLDELERLQRAR